MKSIKKISIIILIITLTIISMGAKSFNATPQTVYRVYLGGQPLGLIKSKQSLEKYIDKEQETLKKKYNVDKIYAPDDLHIQKEITYNEKIYSTSEIYEMIKDKSDFTIKGYAITIKAIKDTSSTVEKKANETQTIYVLDKKVFTDSVDKTVRSFISNEDYNTYESNKTQEIVDTGKIIEKIYIENEIKIKKTNVPASKKIYLSTEELTTYLLFGTSNANEKYIVKSGDTISTVAYNNKMSTDEFLLINTKFKNENSLLYEGEEVNIGILNPQFNIVQENEEVALEEKKYSTETRYDNTKLVGYEHVEQAGVNGINKVTQKIRKINGETTNIVTVNTEEIKPVVNEILIKGGKQSNYDYTGGKYGNLIVTAGEWGWPASCSSVSSGFGYRWGALHDGMDIAGCGYGSNIFASQAGTVVASKKKPGGYAGGYGDNGEYIIIDHHNGYYTIYAHLCPGCRYVTEGQNVTKGQVIGGMGHTGAATGTHLHFGFWAGFPYYGGRALNPAGIF
ncbi:MAG: peptidoglycan DD-metalloendopeptidase family protein [Bacilli bacterium]|nr:peptidoglycan DD-metalloendopeptidase family protein [Bacilli bacterium]